MASFTVVEQYLLELVNAERAKTGLQPLANDTALDASADAHTQWLFDNDVFQHTADLVGLIGANGWEWRAGSYGFWENHQWEWGYYTDPQQVALHEFQNYMNSESHRAAILNPNIEAAGMSFGQGEFAGYDGAFVTTMHFGYNERPAYLTGVAFGDLDGDHSYDPGEQLAGVTVDVTRSDGSHVTTATSATGGYDLMLGPGTYGLEFERADGSHTPLQTITVGEQNVKLDATADTFVFDQTLTGTSKNNVLTGGGGDDTISGLGGNDTITGAGGGDHLWGGPGADAFVFRAGFGHDEVGDFKAGNGKDHDFIDLAANTGLTSFSQVLAHAIDTASGTLITTDAGDSVLLDGIHRADLTKSDFHFI